MVDLAQRGYLRISEERTDRLIGKDKVIYRFDNRCCTTTSTGSSRGSARCCSGCSPASSRRPRTTSPRWARANQSEAQSFWRGFRASVKDEVERKGYLAGHRLGPFLGAIAIVIALIAFAVVMFSTGTLWGLVPIGAAVGLFFFMRTLLQRTPAGARRAAEWDGLRSFLKDFSRLDEAVSGDMIIYERYLVAAVALGVADELVRGLSLKVPEVVANPRLRHLVRGLVARPRARAAAAWATSARSTRRSARPPAPSPRSPAAPAAVAGSPVVEEAEEAVAASVPADGASGKADGGSGPADGDRSTIAVYERRAAEWKADAHTDTARLEQAEQLAQRVAGRGERRPRCGRAPGARSRMRSRLVPAGTGAPDRRPRRGARRCSTSSPATAPLASRVQADLRPALRPRRGSPERGPATPTSTWPGPRCPLALADLHRALRVGAPLQLGLSTATSSTPTPRTTFAGRRFSAWPTIACVDVADRGRVHDR